MGEHGNTVLIDGDPFTYQAAFSKEESLEDAIEYLDELIDDCIFGAETQDYEVYLTGKGNFRYDIAVTHEYKGNRKNAEKPRFLPELRQHMIDNWGAVVSEGEEADDLIAIEATAIGPTAIIASIDKDFLQVPGMNYNPRQGLLRYVSEFDGLKFFYTQILTGDRADNIIGLYGVGPKKAEKLLADCKTEEDLYLACLHAYGGDEERLVENGRLLWLRRYEGQIWEPPKCVSDPA